LVLTYICVILFVGVPRPDDFFDYVHHRLLVLAMPKEIWPKYIKECVRICAPGGWIEMLETDMLIHNAGPACEKLNDVMRMGFKARGLDMDAPDRIQYHFEEEGLGNITFENYMIPISSCGGPLAEFFWTNQANNYRAIRNIIKDKMDVTDEEFEKLLSDATEELKHRQSHLRGILTIGQKQ
jgi:ubiquinone/menaquinone biosynthesis C-methylase UbiE